MLTGLNQLCEVNKKVTDGISNTERDPESPAKESHTCIWEYTIINNSSNVTIGKLTNPIIVIRLHWLTLSECQTFNELYNYVSIGWCSV